VQADIARYGELRSELGTGAARRTALVGELPLAPRARSLALAWGDWLGPAALAGAALLLALGRAAPGAAPQAGSLPRR
jgi:hypothetical protein